LLPSFFGSTSRQRPSTCADNRSSRHRKQSEEASSRTADKNQSIFEGKFVDRWYDNLKRIIIVTQNYSALSILLLAIKSVFGQQPKENVFSSLEVNASLRWLFF
jgi:hypothetical protein